MKKTIKIQKTHIIKSKKDASHTEQSQYWDFNNRMRSNADETIAEHRQANPDVLPDLENTGPSTPQMVMGEAIAHLQGRQKEVYLLVMRENKSLSETAEILSIEKSSVQRYKERAIKFLTQYCKSAIEKGRV
jgi:DNA-directed RNA polymerase specialized sigma subunit